MDTGVQFANACWELYWNDMASKKLRWRSAQSYMRQGLSLAHLRNERSDWLKVPGSLDEVQDGSRQKSRWRETLEPYFKFIILAKILETIQPPSQG